MRDRSTDALGVQLPPSISVTGPAAKVCTRVCVHFCVRVCMVCYH